MAPNGLIGCLCGCQPQYCWRDLSLITLLKRKWLMWATMTAPQRAKRSHFRNLRCASKISLVCKVFVLLVGLVSLLLHASDRSPPELFLSCSVHSDNFGKKPGLLMSKELSIKGSVLARGGSVLVYETDDLEFWALTHMTQELNGHHFINNFEMSIKDKSTNRFYNALSDSVFSEDRSPQSARIRIANYYPGTFHEKSYIMFRCKSVTGSP